MNNKELNDKKHQTLKLLKNLEEYHGSKNPNDYRYMGGAQFLTRYDAKSKKKMHNVHYKYLLQLINENKDLKKTIDMLDIHDEYEYDLTLDKSPYKCICGQNIFQRCFIIKRDKQLNYINFITVGNCCIRLFFAQKKSLKECKCGNEHRNIKDNKCNECRYFSKRKPKDFIINFGKYKHKSILWILENDPNYIEYLKKNEFVQTKMIKLANFINDLEIN